MEIKKFTPTLNPLIADQMIRIGGWKEALRTIRLSFTDHLVAVHLYPQYRFSKVVGIYKVSLI